jgi:hypothetical protein
MNAACHDQPISFLRLERYLQGDVDATERERVGAHLRACELCRGCYEELQAENVELLPLPEAVLQQAQRANPPRWRRVSRRWPQLTAAVALAAAVALWVRAPDSERPALPAARVAIKGGELGLELVREHAGALANDSDHFAAGDRLQARVSCPPGRAVHWDLVVYQDGQAFFPLTPATKLSCANGVTLPAAFMLDGGSRAAVCVVIDAEAVLERARLREPAGLPGSDAACLIVRPAGTP